MAIIEMKKVSAFVMRKDARRVLHALQEAGVAEISSIKLDEGYHAEDNSEEILSLEGILAEIRYALGVVRRYDHSKKSFLTPKPVITPEQFRALPEKEGEVQEFVALAKDIDHKMNNIRQKYSRIQNLIAQLTPFEKLDVPISEIGSTRYTESICAFIPKDVVSDTKAQLDEFDGLACIDILDENMSFTMAFIVAHGTVSEKTHAALKSLGVTEARFERFSGTIRERVEELNNELAQLDKERIEQEKRAEQAAIRKNLLLAYEDYLQNELARAEALGRLGATESVNLMEGYIRAADEAKTIEAVTSITDVYYMEVTVPGEDDDPPVSIENKSGLRPFEAVTEMYATPAYKGIDPVYVMAPFYLIFFGMMLSDAVYGLVLAIGAFVVLKIKKPDGMFRKVTTLLIYCGISTIIWGLLFGGAMGFEIQALLFNPLNQPINMLLLCVGIGVLHMIVAFCTGFYMLCRDGRVWDAIFDKGTWLLVMLSLPFIALGMTMQDPATGGLLTNIGTIMALVGIGGVVLTAGRANKGILKKLMGGLAGIYDVTGYVSDILSYCRIFGMSLATAVIAMVFNTIAGMLMGNVIGAVFGVAVFAVGHIFNLGINALGSYVHSIRLQYIESYNKFFEGGGRVFKPLGFRVKSFRVENAK